MLVDLRDRVGEFGAVAGEGAAATPQAAAASDSVEPVVSALINLGTARARAEQAAREALSAAPPDAALEAVIRAALRRLAR